MEVGFVMTYYCDINNMSRFRCSVRKSVILSACSVEQIEIGVVLFRIWSINGCCDGLLLFIMAASMYVCALFNVT